VPVVGANTWGISGSHFLLLYGSLSVAWGLVLWLLRWYLLRGTDTGGDDLSAYELAMLNGGAGLAVTAAAARLHSFDVLEPGAELRTLRASGQLGSDPDPLDREVFEAVYRQPGIPIRKLRAQLAAGEAARDLVRGLVNDGLMLRPRAVRQLRLLWVWGTPVLALGVARLIAGIHNHKPIGYLAVMVCWVAVGIGWLALRRDRATSAGLRELKEQRKAERYWRAAPAEIAPSLAVALFGGAALWAIDPAFAAAWSVPREKAAGWIGTYAGYGGGGCGGGGGGGGGCGG